MTTQQQKQGLALMRIICETVREVGEAPSGVVYAALMSHCALAAYESLVSQLCGTGLISQRNNVLIWVGPKAV